MQKQSSQRKAAPSGICDSQKATTSVTTSSVCPVCTEAQKVKRSNITRRTRTLLDSCSSAKMSFQICQPRTTSTLPQPKLHFTVLQGSDFMLRTRRHGTTSGREKHHQTLCSKTHRAPTEQHLTNQVPGTHTRTLSGFPCLEFIAQTSPSRGRVN